MAVYGRDIRGYRLIWTNGPSRDDVASAAYLLRGELDIRDVDVVCYERRESLIDSELKSELGVALDQRRFTRVFFPSFVDPQLVGATLQRGSHVDALVVHSRDRAAGLVAESDLALAETGEAAVRRAMWSR